MKSKNLELEWLWRNCTITYWPRDGGYPIEHNRKANKDSREMIEMEMAIDALDAYYIIKDRVK